MSAFLTGALSIDLFGEVSNAGYFLPVSGVIYGFVAILAPRQTADDAYQHHSKLLVMINFFP